MRNYTRIEEVSLKEVKPKTLLIHGKDDQLIQIGHSFELFKLLQNPATPAWISGADHNNIYEFSEVWLRLMTFVEEIYPELYGKMKKTEFEEPRAALLKMKEKPKDAAQGDDKSPETLASPETCYTRQPSSLSKKREQKRTDPLAVDNDKYSKNYVTSIA